MQWTLTFRAKVINKEQKQMCGLNPKFKLKVVYKGHCTILLDDAVLIHPECDDERTKWEA